MKKLGIALVVILILIGGIYYFVKSSNDVGKYNTSTKSYIGNPEQCKVINYGCNVGSVPFSDEKGCGCMTVTASTSSQSR